MQQQQGSAAAAVHDRPTFHLRPAQGWVNDPNGPLLYNGVYHMFFQHLPGAHCAWDFGLVWGHAISTDLVTWVNLPPALVPTPGSMDQDGCFSGCATVDTDGKPIILYTGVRLRASPTCGPLPPPECDLGLPFIESQCAAVPADPDDPRLEFWTKVDVPIMALPPPDMNLAGWRDPYIISRPDDPDGDGMWSLVIGSGIKDVGGWVPVYKSKHLLHGWELTGTLCEGDSSDPGIMWECPLFCKLPALDPDSLQIPSHDPLPSRTASSIQTADMSMLSIKQQHLPPLAPAASGVLAAAAAAAAAAVPRAVVPAPGARKAADPRYDHFFCQSPDSIANPSYVWLGRREEDEFVIEEAIGPFKLDHGDVLYAPNTLLDAKGRTLLWGWLQEQQRKVGTYDYAGCLSVPRILSIQNPPPGHSPAVPPLSSGLGDYDGGSRTPDASLAHLFQQPIPELSSLRISEGAWLAGHAAISRPPRDSRRSLDMSAFESRAVDTMGASWRRSGASSIGRSARVSIGGRPSGLAWMDGTGSGSGVATEGLDKSGGSAVAPRRDSDPLVITSGSTVPIPEVSGAFIDMELLLLRGSSSSKAVTGTAAASEAAVDVAQQSNSSKLDNVDVSSTFGRVGDSTIPNIPHPSSSTKHDTSSYVHNSKHGDSTHTAAISNFASHSGVLLRSWQSGHEGHAALLYHWETGLLEVVWEAAEAPISRGLLTGLTAPACRRAGGVLRRPPPPGQPLSLRIFIDYSLVEVFTGGGEVLTARVYRGAAGREAGANLELLSLGGDTTLLSGAAYEMRTALQAPAPEGVRVAVPATEPTYPDLAEAEAEPGAVILTGRETSESRLMAHQISQGTTPGGVFSQGTTPGGIFSQGMTPGMMTPSGMVTPGGRRTMTARLRPLTTVTSSIQLGPGSNLNLHTLGSMPQPFSKSKSASALASPQHSARSPFANMDHLAGVGEVSEPAGGSFHGGSTLSVHASGEQDDEVFFSTEDDTNMFRFNLRAGSLLQKDLEVLAQGGDVWPLRLASDAAMALPGVSGVVQAKEVGLPTAVLSRPPVVKTRLPPQSQALHVHMQQQPQLQHARDAMSHVEGLESVSEVPQGQESKKAAPMATVPTL